MGAVTEICLHAFKPSDDGEGTTACDEHDPEKSGYCVYERLEADDPRAGSFDIGGEWDFTGPHASERAFGFATLCAERLGVSIDEY